MSYELVDKSVNYREKPEKYIIGRGQFGMLIYEPYKSELLPFFRYKSVKAAKRSIEKILYRFNKYIEEGDFVGADMSKKYLHGGYTRSLRYANYNLGRKYDENGEEKEKLKLGDRDKEKCEITKMYKEAWKEAIGNEKYKEMKREFRKKYK